MNADIDQMPLARHSGEAPWGGGGGVHTEQSAPSTSLLLSNLELSDKKSMSLEYEPASEPLHHWGGQESIRDVLWPLLTRPGSFWTLPLGWPRGFRWLEISTVT